MSPYPGPLYEHPSRGSEIPREERTVRDTLRVYGRGDRMISCTAGMRFGSVFPPRYW